MLRVSILLVSLAWFGWINCLATDKTLEPRASGADVVDASIRKIHESKIFADDCGFLRRIAYVESRFGEHKNTFRDGYYGGIWQVDRIGFLSTQKNRPEGPSTNLKRLHDAIRTKLNSKDVIDWPKVQWEDLQKPLYSALAARLFLANKAGRIPCDRSNTSATVSAQAAYWKEHYNTAAGKGTVAHFEELVKNLEG